MNAPTTSLIEMKGPGSDVVCDKTSSGKHNGCEDIWLDLTLNSDIDLLGFREVLRNMPFCCSACVCKVSARSWKFRLGQGIQTEGTDVGK